ncbi:MAG: His/Gly/Thr/Pro-type tRNA ligase C-terminal domain-containing protein [bacterium]
MEKVKETNTSESYLFINFSETIDEITSLYRQFIAAGKRCELYPTAAKLGKQFEYADRVGADYSIVYGP